MVISQANNLSFNEQIKSRQDKTKQVCAKQVLVFGYCIFSVPWFSICMLNGGLLYSTKHLGERMNKCYVIGSNVSVGEMWLVDSLKWWGGGMVGWGGHVYKTWCDLKISFILAFYSESVGDSSDRLLTLKF